MQHVLVTGGAGYLGSLLVPQLISAGCHVTSVDWEYPEPHEGANSCHVPADLRSWSPHTPFDGCIHLAAIVGIDYCAQHAVLARQVNQFALLRAMQWPVARHLYISTGGVYGPVSGDLTEHDEINPEGVYCETKAIAEQAALDAGGCVLRLNHLTGVAPRMRWREIGNNLARDATRGELNIYDPDLSRPYLHVQDAARLITLIMLMEDFPVAQIYNVAAENRTKRAIGVELAELTGTRVHFESRGIDHWNYRLTSDRLREELGLMPELTLSDALREVVRCR